MFGRNLKLFTIFGFKVRVNISWAFLALLIALSLALGFFPRVYEGWPTATYWWMAAGGVIGVFFPSSCTNFPIRSRRASSARA